MTHVYLSTSCLHDEHDYCQSEHGATGEKHPAQCKFCAAPCICTCHGGSGLAPFTGAHARCPMCTGDVVGVEYQPPLKRTGVHELNGARVVRGPLPARLERECHTCGYRWDENTAYASGGFVSGPEPSTPPEPES